MVPNSSPATQSAATQAPRRATLLRAIIGPVLLVTLGALFLLDYSGGVSFGRTWPVLLIIFGVLKLAEHAGTRGGSPTA